MNWLWLGLGLWGACSATEAFFIVRYLKSDRAARHWTVIVFTVVLVALGPIALLATVIGRRLAAVSQSNPEQDDNL